MRYHLSMYIQDLRQQIITKEKTSGLLYTGSSTYRDPFLAAFRGLHAGPSKNFFFSMQNIFWPVS